MKKGLCLLLLIASIVNAFAAPKLPPKGAGPAKATLPEKDIAKTSDSSFEPYSFDALNADIISPKYAGIPIGLAITSIEKMIRLKKGEFETTAEFQARQKAAIESSFLGNIKLTDILPFVVNVQRKGYNVPLYYSYNADKAEVSLTDSSAKKSYNGIGGQGYFSAFNRPSYYTFILAKDFDPKETYSASNAYGATVTVEKLGVTEYGIATDDGTSFSISNLSMESNIAASELPSLKALILVKSKAPYLIYDFNHIDPTRDSPVELSVRTRSLIGDVLGVIYFSGKTGRVIARSPGLAPAKEGVSETH